MSDRDQPAGDTGRGTQTRWAAALARLSYANVAATLALFLALGGTATAVAKLEPDSVGTAQIRDAGVRSADLHAGSVGRSEIRDESVSLADLAPGARTALDAPRVRLAKDDGADVSGCSRFTDCSNLVSLPLHTGGWMVQAKFTLRNNGSTSISTACALVQDDETVLDSLHSEVMGQRGTLGSMETAVLTAVLPETSDDTIALRCVEDPDEFLAVDGMTLTALEVGPVTEL